jgi:fucose permease
MDVRKLLGSFAVIAIILLAVSLFGETRIVVYTFPACGLFFAIMYPCILSLGMNTVTEHSGALSGILCTGISGAAVIALLIGYLGDMIGLRGAMCLIFLALIYVLFISAWAKPIVKNKKIF